MYTVNARTHSYTQNGMMIRTRKKVNKIARAVVLVSLVLSFMLAMARLDLFVYILAWISRIRGRDKHKILGRRYGSVWAAHFALEFRMVLVKSGVSVPVSPLKLDSFGLFCLMIGLEPRRGGSKYTNVLGFWRKCPFAAKWNSNFNWLVAEKLRILRNR